MTWKKFYRSPYWIFLAVAVIESAVFWPGILRPDSMGQMSLAMGNFTAGSDHHPPIMAILWHYAALIIPGSGGMLIVHEIIFWTGIFFFYRALKHPAARAVLIISVFLPQLFVLRPFILKDIGFAVCYVCAAGILTYINVQRRSLRLMESIPILILLFYGSAVKFQAIYVASPFLLWMVSLCPGMKKTAKKIIYATVAHFIFYTAVNVFNHHTSSPSHSWQYVKLYDLAGISLYEGRTIFPEFALNPDTYSFKRLQELYSPLRVDEMAFPEDAILKRGTTAEQRENLQVFWFMAVAQHPLAYLHHRWGVFKKQLTLSPLKAPSEIKSNLNESPSAFIQIGYWLERWQIMDFCKTITSFAPFLGLMFFYILMGARGKTSLHNVLFMMNFSGLTLVMVLFALSMAAEFRYLYFSMYMLHISHALGLEIYLNWRKRLTKNTLEYA